MPSQWSMQILFKENTTDVWLFLHAVSCQHKGWGWRKVFIDVCPPATFGGIRWRYTAGSGPTKIRSGVSSSCPQTARPQSNPASRTLGSAARKLLLMGTLKWTFKEEGAGCMVPHFREKRTDAARRREAARAERRESEPGAEWGERGNVYGCRLWLTAWKICSVFHYGATLRERRGDPVETKRAADCRNLFNFSSVCRYNHITATNYIISNDVGWQITGYSLWEAHKTLTCQSRFRQNPVRSPLSSNVTMQNFTVHRTPMNLEANKVLFISLWLHAITEGTGEKRFCWVMSVSAGGGTGHMLIWAEKQQHNVSCATNTKFRFLSQNVTKSEAAITWILFLNKLLLFKCQ